MRRFVQRSGVLSDGQIYLPAGECHYTHLSQEGYTVARGRISVCVTPWTQTGRFDFTCQLCQMAEGTVPAYAWRDERGEAWHFALVAQEDTLLVRTPCQPGDLARFIGETEIPFRPQALHRDIAAYAASRMGMSSQGMFLNPEKHYVTRDENDVWMLTSGKVNVYIAPVDAQGYLGKWEYLREASAEDVSIIPGLNADTGEGRLCLLFRPSEGAASLERTRCTQAARRNFLRNTEAEAYLIEGFEQACIQLYRQKNDLAHEIRRQEKAAQAQEISRDQRSALHHGVGIEQAAASSGSGEWYQALHYLCKHGCISLPAEDELQRRTMKTDMSLNDMAQAGHFIAREVVLQANWWTSDCGMLLCTRSGHPVACLPKSRGRYRYFVPHTGETGWLTPNIARTLEPQAHSIRRALPAAALKRKDIIRFVLQTLQVGDILWLVFLGAICTAVSLLLPALEQQIYDSCIPMGEIGMLVQLCIVTGAFMLGNVFFSLVQNLFEFRISTRSGYEMQDALYYRVFEMKESFLRTFDSGDLAQRVISAGSLVNDILKKALVTGLSTVFSLLYLFQMFKYAKALALPAMLMALLLGAAAYLLSLLALPHQKVQAKSRNEEMAKLHQYLDGVQKIRMAGVEDRAILDYTQTAAVTQRASILSNRIASLAGVVRDAAPTLFAMALYYLIIHGGGGLSTGQFVAFNSAFGSLCGAIMALVGELTAYCYLKPAMALVSPLLSNPPEMTEEEAQSCPEELDGAVSLEHVTFAYTPGAEPVLRDVSIRIKPREYVALVGPSGCGKSTIFKLLLGFETPQNGCVKYGASDLAAMNKHALRRKLGAVLQNGSLIAGSIYENITITMERPTRKAAESAVDRVGLREDIDQMPMGLETVISESAGTISGGQKQRILIARAIAGDPKILLFDEATSALDNITQAKVCQSLEEMDVTRIVIAHRLSTIRRCDRILVMDKGRIVQEGGFQELYDQPGLFHDMAVRQIAEGEDEE